MLLRCASRANALGLADAAKKVVYRRISGHRAKSFSASFFAALSVVFLGIGAPALAQLPSDDFFPIGVHSQPTTSFAKWKARGLNTMYQYEGMYNYLGQPTVSIAQWDAAAVANGLYFVRRPSDNPSNDLQQKNLLAWAQGDEPDLVNHDPVPQHSIDSYQNLKAISPTKPVWINFAGPLVTPASANYKQWVKAGDWVGADWYPVNWGRPNNLNFVGLEMDQLRTAAAGKPKKLVAYIETSYQWINTTGGRAPTPGEFRAEVWNAINHGATSLIYFPQVVGRAFQFDGTADDVVAEMTTQNAKIQRLAKALNSTWNPAGRTLGFSSSSLEGSWRVTQQGDYFFALNMSTATLTDVNVTLGGLTQGITSLDVVDENRTESLLTGGNIVDTFQPYELHIYHASLSGAAGASPVEVPEPATLGAMAAAMMMGMMRRPGRRAA